MIHQVSIASSHCWDSKALLLLGYMSIAYEHASRFSKRPICWRKGISTPAPRYRVCAIARGIAGEPAAQTTIRGQILLSALRGLLPFIKGSHISIWSPPWPVLLH